VENQVEELGYRIRGENLLLEQTGKNTLPAITWAMKEIARTCPDEPTGVFPSDHRMDTAAMESVQKAGIIAGGSLVTFGITPSRPHTGYGYIAPGEESGPGFLVREFHEKPDQETAREYVDAGYLWNSGMLLSTPSFFLSQLEEHQPEYSRAFRENRDPYAVLDPLSVDYGLLELSNRVVVVPLDSGWSDLGNFASLHEDEERDTAGNVGGTRLIDTGNCLFLHPEKKHVCAIGVKDLVVVDTPDALLVCDRNRTEQVRELVRAFEAAGDPVAEHHTLVHRPWGSYLSLETFPFFRIKRITVKPGKWLSLQMHYHRSEHWVVVSGTAEIQLAGETRLLRQGESTFVPAGSHHRLGNPGMIPLELIEVQIGEFLSEDDIVRMDDHYGRVTPGLQKQLGSP
jgi:mannose-1-phosphate guanylyltransferase/mannose-6-phosphate isomerase